MRQTLQVVREHRSKIMKRSTSCRPFLLHSLFHRPFLRRSQFLSSFASSPLPPFSRDKPKEIHPVSFISSSSSSSSRQCQLLSRCRNSTNWKITFPRAPCSICSVVKTSKENASRPPLFSSSMLVYHRCLETGTTSFHLLFSCFFLSFFLSVSNRKNFVLAEQEMLIIDYSSGLRFAITFDQRV